jgi:formyl-CoA transferase
MGGLRYVTGEPDRAPSRAGISIGDSLAATFACIGTLAALHERERSGRGQVVDSAIYEAVLAMMESLVPEWQVAGYQRERTGAILPNIAPSNLYPTADGQTVLIAANQDTVFTRLAGAMGEPDLARDERYATHGARGAHQQDLDDHIATWTAKRDADDLLKMLEDHGVPAGRTYRAQDMLRDPHMAARGSLVRVHDPRFGELAMQNVAPRLSRTPGGVRWTGPDLGEHTREVLGDVLGLPDDEIDRLAADGTI